VALLRKERDRHRTYKLKLKEVRDILKKNKE
jgi:hypothetical protein